MARKSLRTNHRSGWLQVLTVPGGVEIPIPEYLQVEHEGTRVNIPPTKKNISGARVTGQASGKVYVCAQTPADQTYHIPADPEGREREFCTILEGPYRGKKIAALALKNGGRFHPLTVTAGAYLVFTLDKVNDGDHTRGILQYGPTQVEAFTSADNKVPAGEFALQLPDAPHEGGGFYEGQCDSPKTWFRVGPSSSSRYLHPGMRSAGCITIAPEGWNLIYRPLITARKGDGINVGTVKVIHSR